MEKGVNKYGKEKNQNLFCGAGLELDIHICTKDAVLLWKGSVFCRVLQRASGLKTTSEVVVKVVRSG